MKVEKMFKGYRRFVLRYFSGIRSWLDLYFKRFRKLKKRLGTKPVNKSRFSHNIPFTTQKWSIRGYLAIFLVLGIPFLVFVWFTVVYLL
jgi:hypothetical protein